MIELIKAFIQGWREEAACDKQFTPQELVSQSEQELLKLMSEKLELLVKNAQAEDYRVASLTLSTKLKSLAVKHNWLPLYNNKIWDITTYWADPQDITVVHVHKERIVRYKYLVIDNATGGQWQTSEVEYHDHYVKFKSNDDKEMAVYGNFRVQEL